jgi:hypothetical protein
VQLQAELSWVIDFGIVVLDLVGLRVSSGPGEEKSDPRGGQAPPATRVVRVQQRLVGQGDGTSLQTLRVRGGHTALRDVG